MLNFLVITARWCYRRIPLFFGNDAEVFRDNRLVYHNQTSKGSAKKKNCRGWYSKHCKTCLNLRERNTGIQCTILESFFIGFEIFTSHFSLFFLKGCVENILEELSLDHSCSQESTLHQEATQEKTIILQERLLSCNSCQQELRYNFVYNPVVFCTQQESKKIDTSYNLE